MASSIDRSMAGEEAPVKMFFVKLVFYQIFINYRLKVGVSFHRKTDIIMTMSFRDQRSSRSSLTRSILDWMARIRGGAVPSFTISPPNVHY